MAVSVETGDIDRIQVDKTLVGKLSSETVSDGETECGIPLCFKETKRLVVAITVYSEWKDVVVWEHFITATSNMLIIVMQL